MLHPYNFSVNNKTTLLLPLPEFSLYLLAQVLEENFTVLEALLKLPVEKKILFSPIQCIFHQKKSSVEEGSAFFPPSSLPILFHHESCSIRVLMFLSINDGFTNGDLSLKLLVKT